MLSKPINVTLYDKSSLMCKNTPAPCLFLSNLRRQLLEIVHVELLFEQVSWRRTFTFYLKAPRSYFSFCGWPFYHLCGVPSFCDWN